MALKSDLGSPPSALPRSRALSTVQLPLDHVPRDTGEPSAHMARLVTTLVHLLRFRSVEYSWYRREFEMSERQFIRDLQHLRKILDDIGLRLSNRKDGRVTLAGADGWNQLAGAAGDQLEALRAVARALGGPAARDLGSQAAEDDRRERFLLFAMPRLEVGSDAAEVFDALKAAHEKRARVRFRYRGRYDDVTAREVEPYRVLAHAGRYFLIGYDVQPRKGWRYFALDRIVGTPARSGTFTPRSIPPAYLACDAVGMMQTGGAVTEVTVRLSPVIAASVTSRRWQGSQRVSKRRDGSADITFAVADVDEAIRWALGFGAEAWVIAPPRAVAAARRTVDEMLPRYAVAQPAIDRPRQRRAQSSGR
jgi:predicted DNA-binding transcriptional regulator YafY